MYKPHETALETVRFSKFVESKVRTWYRMIDVSKDGCMGRDDFQIIANRLVKLYNLDESRAQVVSDWLVSGWDLALRDATGATCDDVTTPLIVEVCTELKTGNKITEDQFVAAIQQLVTVQPVMAKALMEQMFGCFFEIFDINEDGSISRDEMAVAMRCFGFDDIDRLTRAYNLMVAEEDGKLSRDDYVNVWVDFMIGQDNDNAFTICFAPHAIRKGQRE